MKLLEISPFLRIALRYSLIQKPIDSYSLDNRLFYVIKGNGSIYINGEPHSIKPDTLFLWQRGTAYRFEFEGENGEVKSEIYDLTGRKLKGENGNLKGMYIIDGKKVFIK